MRKAAQNLTLTKWEMLKACKTIIDDQDEAIKSMSVKGKMKENVMWKNEDLNNYNEWK